ncbi:MAG: transposase [Elainellaceae cyanobacterium]
MEIDEFVVMPNHVHGILMVGDRGTAIRRTHTSTYRRGPACRAPTGTPDGDHGGTPNGDRKFGKPTPGTLPTIVRSYKSATTRQINILRDSPGTLVWQRNYYERIVRDDEALHNIRRYIRANPRSWWKDRLRPHSDRR